jgi:elongation factor P--beta-lysine ligase
MAPIVFDPLISNDCKQLIKDILKHNPRERLSMNQIFANIWVVRYAKEYKIDLASLIYKESADQ